MDDVRTVDGVEREGDLFQNPAHTCDGQQFVFVANGVDEFLEIGTFEPIHDQIPSSIGKSPPLYEVHDSRGAGQSL